MSSTLGDVSTLDDDVVLLAPEEEFVPEDSEHDAIASFLRAGLMAKFAGREDVVVFRELAWFPDRSDTRIRLDPDLMVVFDRPKGRRKSYRQWAENGIPPTVVIEIRSEDDTDADYMRRLGRARQYGVEQVVMVAPFGPGGVTVQHMLPDPVLPARWRIVQTSTTAEAPIRIDRLDVSMSGGGALVVSDEHGRWIDGPEGITLARAESARADAESARADAESVRADAESVRADAEAAKVRRLQARLRKAGLDFDE